MINPNATMKSGNRDKAEGTAKDAAGHIKEKVGKVTNNPDLEGKGLKDQAEGHAQKGRGEVKKVFGK